LFLQLLITVPLGNFVIVRIRPLILTMAAAASLTLLFVGIGCAQENPFGGGGAPASAAKPAQVLEEPQIAPDAPATSQLLIRSVKQSNPQTPTELAKAVKVMLDLGQFEFAKFYLSRLMAVELEDQQRADVVREMGSDFFFELHATDELAPEGRDFSRRMLAANRVFRQSPDQLGQLIGKLNDPNIAIRSRAFRSLRSVGTTAIAALIEVFADADRKDDFPGVRGALQNIGPQSVPLLRGATVSNHPVVKAEALRALANYRSEGVADVLAAAALSSSHTERVRAIATLAMRDQGYSMPDPSELIARLQRRTDALLTGRQRLRGSLESMLTVWRWDSETNRLQSSRATVATASRYEAARLAGEVYGIDPQSRSSRQLYLLTQLEAAKRSVGTEGESAVVTAKAFYKELPSAVGTVTPQEFNELLKYAVEKKAVLAATACCELLAETNSADVFYSSGSRMPPVVRAIMLGDRHLQFAALNMIDRLDPAVAYPGSSLAVKLAVFLSNTGQRSVGLVGHHRLELAQTVAGSLLSAGMSGLSASSSRNFFEQAIADPDISLLLISDTLVRPRFDELVRQLRADFRTARIPIGLMVRDGDRHQAVSRMITEDPLTYSFPVAVDGDPLISNVRRAASLDDADLFSVSVGDRYRHAVLAAQWLAKISSDREKFGFYELGPHQQQLAGLLYRPGLEKSASEILANLGTPLSQRELANFASQSSLAAPVRRVAADSLSRSIERGSTLLTRDQIKQQYDRYNASEKSADGSTEILGSILDSIEQRRSISR